jgi:hypothetical protein
MPVGVPPSDRSDPCQQQERKHENRRIILISFLFTKYCLLTYNSNNTIICTLNVCA